MTTPTERSPVPRPQRPWALRLWAAGLCAVLLSMCAAPLLGGGEGTGAGLAEGEIDGDLATELIAPPQVVPQNAHEPGDPAATNGSASSDPSPQTLAAEADSANTPDAGRDAPADDEDSTSDDGDRVEPAPAEARIPPATPVRVDEEVPELRRAAIRLDGERVDEGQLEAVRAADGVTDVTGITVGDVTVPGPAGPQEVTLAGVDVNAFRPFTPQVSAERRDLWERIAEGDAAFTHHTGYGLELVLGGWVSPDGNGDTRDEEERVNHFSLAATGAIDILDPEEDDGAPAPAPEGGPAVRVGAFASNGVPPVADAMVSATTAADMGADQRAALLVAVDEEADIEALAQALADQTGFEAEVIPEPVPQPADSPDIPDDAQDLPGDRPDIPNIGDGDEEIEPFDYIDNGDGTIQIQGDWVARNIVTERLPIFEGNATCHRVMMPRVIGALQEIEEAGLAHLIDTNDYGGCWVARHIDWNPSRPLSMHAWGLAIDFNVQTNQLGQEPQLDMRIVEVFERWGFTWGGHWNRPDGMHFEYGNPPG